MEQDQEPRPSEAIEAQPAEATEEERREFLARAGKAAIAVPAATLLLAATAKRAGAFTASEIR